MPDLNMILHTIIPFATGAGTYALGSTAVRSIRRRCKKHYLASQEYRNRQALLRQQSREKMSAIMAETNDPWAAPEVSRNAEAPKAAL